MARKDQELRPVMTRIPEGLRRRLEREAKFRGRSMNAEIIKRLQESFDIPEQAAAIVEDVGDAINDAYRGIEKRLDKLLFHMENQMKFLTAYIESLSPRDPNTAQSPKDEGEGQ